MTRLGVGPGPLQDPDSVDAPQAPRRPAGPPARRLGTSPVLAAVVALLAVGAGVVGATLPFAPTWQPEVELTWPRAGEAPASTAVLVVPDPARSVEATVPCEAVQALDGGSAGAALAFGTTPYDRGRETGLHVLREGADVVVANRGVAVFRETLPPGACTYGVRAADGDLTVTRDGEELAALEAPTPQVTAFVTDATGDAAAGLRASVQLADTYQAVPTALKTALLLLTAGLVLGCLAGLHLLDRRGPRADVATRREWRASRVPAAQRAAADATVVLLVLGWCAVGPMTPDDGFFRGIQGNVEEAGFVGNYYEYLNTPEGFFSWPQRMYAWWGDLVGHNMLLMRLVAAVAGVLTWLVLSRGLLPRSGAVRTQTWVAALAFAVWWMAFNTGTRPEPLVALGVTLTLALLVRGLEHDRTLPVGVAALVAAATVAVTTSGFLAAAPVLVLLPWLVAMAARRRWAGALAALAAAAVGTATLLLVAFHDQTLTHVSIGSEVHHAIGPSFTWDEEVVRYTTLLADGFDGNVARRGAVVLTLALVVVVVLLRVDRTTGSLRRMPPRADVAAVTFLVGIVLLAATPTKWTHHFGSLAGVGAVAAAGALATVVATVRAGRAPGSAWAALVVSVLASALAFATVNAWWSYANDGQPWQTGVEALGIDPGHPATWVAVAGGACLLLLLLARRAGSSTGAAAGRALTALPVAVPVVAFALVLAVLVTSFAVATYRLRGSWSMAEESLDTVLGRSTTGFAEVVLAHPDAPDPELLPHAGVDSAPVVEGFRRGEATGGSLPPERSVPLTTWGSDAPDVPTGRYTSAWLDLEEARHVALSATGVFGEGNLLEVRHGRVEGGAVRDVGVAPLAGAPVPFGWRELVATVPPTADVVQLHVEDRLVDPGDWLAFTELRRVDAVPLPEVLASSAATFVDWQIAFWFPTASLPAISNGLVEPPEHAIASTVHGWPTSISNDLVRGGTFFAVPHVADSVVVPTSVPNRGGQDWGRLYELRYRYPTDGYDVDVARREVAGW